MTRLHRSAVLPGVIALCASLLAVAGCSSPPTEEIEAAQATIDSVKTLQVVIDYGMSEVAQAERQLASARQMVTEKRYEEALPAALNAQKKARGSVGAAERSRDAAMRDAQQTIAAAGAAITEAEEAIPNAPRWGKGAIRDLSELRADVQTAKDQLAGAEEQNAGDMYREAAAAARNSKAIANSVTGTVNAAIELRESARRR